MGLEARLEQTNDKALLSAVACQFPAEYVFFFFFFFCEKAIAYTGIPVLTYIARGTGGRIKKRIH